MMEMPDFIYVLPSYEGNESGFYDLDPRDGDKYHHSRVVEALREENDENCRLLGKSAERELALLSEIDRLKAKYQETDVLYWQQVREIDKRKEKLNRLLPDDLCPLDDKSWQQSDAFGRIEYLVSAYKSNRDELKMVWEWVVELKERLAIVQPPTTEETKCLK